MKEEMNLTVPKRLSLCMIVKDEEDCIGRCLASVKDMVDEIIIVDTGSTDRTKEICHTFGAQVHDFVWNNSFAEARNDSLQRATGDWILWLDADEEVDPTDRHRLRDILDQDTHDVMLIHLINYYGEEVDPTKVFNMGQNRLFRNHKGFKFQNNIHEVLNIYDMLATTEQQERLGSIPIKVYHYGYLSPITTKKNKLKRNIDILKKELEKADFSPWVLYYLASEYYGAQQYEDAFEYINKAILAFMLEGHTPPAMIYKLKYTVLIQTGNIEGAWPSIEAAIKMYPTYVDLHYCKGVILYLKKMYPEALEALKECVNLGEENLDYLSLKGAGSFYALYYQGRCYQDMGQPDDALVSYIESIITCPTFSDGIEMIRQLLNEKRMTLQEWMKPHYDPATIEQIAKMIYPQKVES
jgi:glycosyltransferase involved in cell wall biosynthesis